MELLQKIVELIPGGEASTVMIIAGVVDFALRMIPSKKPIGIAYMVADGAKLLGVGFAKVGSLLDKVLPQRIKG